MKKLFTLMGLFALSFSFAQNIYLLEDYLKLQTPGASVSLGNAPTENPANARLKSLIFDLLPNVTVTPQQEYQHFKPGLEVPAVIRIDATNLAQFESIQSPVGTVEAVVIKVTSAADFLQKFPASFIQNMPQLKYVYFKCNTGATQDDLLQMLQGEYPGITFLYQVSMPG